MTICLDTTFVVDLLRRDPVAIRAFEEMGDEAPPGVTPISLSFAWLGAMRRSNRRELQALERFETLVRFLPFRPSACRIFGEILAGLDGEGRHIEPEDAMIAAIAMDLGETIVTGDRRHFSRIPGLPLETY